MATNKGHLKAELIDRADALPSGLIELLNSNIKPPTLLTESEIEIRAMYVVSDQVNSFGGRFPEQERSRLAELLVDTPVLIGHRKDKLPVGRTFHAVLTDKEGIPWVKAYFYWSKESDGAADLKHNIDSGIYKECSIAFTFQTPECSVCGHDIRECPHEPFRQYRKAGRDVTCHFDYHGIETVLETSLVYRGAVPGTSISRDLKQSESFNGQFPLWIESPSFLNPDHKYMVIPSYEGFPVRLDHDGIRIYPGDDDIDLPTLAGLSDDALVAQLHDCGIAQGLLVGYRGKERKSKSELVAFLNEGKGPVTRAVLYYLPKTSDDQSVRLKTGRLQVRPFPYRLSTPAELNRAALEIKSRDGVQIVPFNHGSLNLPVYRYCPQTTSVDKKPHYSLSGSLAARNAMLRLHDGQINLGYKIVGADSDRLSGMRQFVAEPITDAVASADNVQHSGQLSDFKYADGSVTFDSLGALHGQYVGRPVTIHQREFFLFRLMNGQHQNHHHNRALSELDAY